MHTLKPPFLDGRISFSMQQTAVSTVKDPTSDIAVNARNGSALLKDVRQKTDAAKMRNRFWELGGSAIGDAMGIKKEPEGAGGGGGGGSRQQSGSSSTSTSSTSTSSTSTSSTSTSKVADVVGGIIKKEPCVDKGDNGQIIADKDTMDQIHLKNKHVDEIDDDDRIDYKDQSSFAKHMKQKSTAQSEFAKSKSLKEQREYLPIFAVRDELLNVIRENQVIVVVGQTGSGKTTQLTQYLYEGR